MDLVRYSAVVPLLLVLLLFGITEDLGIMQSFLFLAGSLRRRSAQD